MKMNKWLRASIILLILALNIGCDQLTKVIVRHSLKEYQVLSYLGNHFTLEKVENTGAFLSLGDSLGGPVHFILLVLLPVAALLAGLIYIILTTTINRLKLLGIIFIIAGGAGNLYDRIVHGSVTDFMHIDFVIFQTGIFNVADMSIMAGMGMIIVDAFLENKRKKAAVQSDETPASPAQ